jgi:hypothetical protein
MGRKPLSPDEKERRKKARSVAYYEANKERLCQAAKDRYDPDRKRHYVQAHYDEVRECQRMCNIKRTHKENYTEILNSLQSVPDGLDFKEAVKRYMDCGVRLMKDDAYTLLRICEAISPRIDD